VTPLVFRLLLKAIRGKLRASARQGAIKMPTLIQLAGQPAFQRLTPMISLTIKVELSYKQMLKLISTASKLLLYVVIILLMHNPA
jgi:hypothetical protein